MISTPGLLRGSGAFFFRVFLAQEFKISAQKFCFQGRAEQILVREF